jgi:hypothetical protein
MHKSTGGNSASRRHALNNHQYQPIATKSRQTLQMSKLFKMGEILIGCSWIKFAKK